MQGAAEDALKRLNPYKLRGVEAFNRSVRVVMRDGAEFFYPDAAALVWNNPADNGKRWLLIWSEHYGSHAFGLEDVRVHAIYARDVFAHLDESEITVTPALPDVPPEST